MQKTFNYIIIYNPIEISNHSSNSHVIWHILSIFHDLLLLQS